MSAIQPEIEALFSEQREFAPTPAFAAQANATSELYGRAEQDVDCLLYTSPSPRD